MINDAAVRKLTEDLTEVAKKRDYDSKRAAWDDNKTSASYHDGIAQGIRLSVIAILDAEKN